ncbi:MAG: 3-hydroxyacyl-CoA dehydrogenase, partial [Rhodobacteraceae bacterium]|nr:3-hydroxyacyl-CoA dehydrogenase [Paracoccaceae bacterium]
EMTQKVEAIIPKDCIFASNTSTLPITDLAKASKRPEQFIGLHFFSPVEKMRLVEIIKGNETGDRATAKALDYVRQIKKTPIVVNDARFFYANRCIIPYINEGARMIAEGVVPQLVDHAAQQLGFPVGPIRLIDETSIDLGANIARATKAALGNAYAASSADDVIFWMEAQGRLGRKTRAGFFEYDEQGKRVQYWKGIHNKFPPTEIQPSLIKVQERLMFIQVLEAVRALEEGVLMDIREGDVGAIFGWGFAPWSGGPFSWLDIIGTPCAARRCDELAEQFGERFGCPPLLREMAEKGETFYGRFGPKVAQAA